MEQDPAHAKRLEEKNTTKKMKFAKQETKAGAPSESSTNTPKRARYDDVGPQEPAITRGSSSSAPGNDVEMRSTSSGKRPLGDDDMVRGREVCDEVDEGNAYVKDCEGDHTDEMIGATLLRDLAEARAEEMAWYEKFEAYE